MNGCLYVVATPIGNLEDLTLRAIRTLKECSLVAAEDTRRTGRLLKHLEISKPMLSYHQFNEAKRCGELVERIRNGEQVALVTDGGTPCISDPGRRLVAAVVSAGLRVEPVPGPCALVAALSAGGLEAEAFFFSGFLPNKGAQRMKRLEQMSNLPGALVFYESPYRVEKLLGELERVYPERQVVLARELTKKFEEFLRGKPGDIRRQLEGRKVKGEVVVIVDEANKKSADR